MILNSDKVTFHFLRTEISKDFTNSGTCTPDEYRNRKQGSQSHGSLNLHSKMRNWARSKFRFSTANSLGVIRDALFRFPPIKIRLRVIKASVGKRGRLFRMDHTASELPDITSGGKDYLVRRLPDFKIEYPLGLSTNAPSNNRAIILDFFAPYTPLKQYA